LFERIRQSAWIDAVTIQVVKKRVNSCAQKHLFFEGVPQQKKSRHDLSNALLFSRFQKFVAGRKKDRTARGFLKLRNKQ